MTSEYLLNCDSFGSVIISLYLCESYSLLCE